MTLQDQPVDPRAIQLGQVFTPSAPIRDATLFSGRGDILIRIADAVNQIGMHCILFGERGVGKTSMANFVRLMLAELATPELTVAQINCDTADRYGTLMRKLMRQVATVQNRPQLGFTAGNDQSLAMLDSRLPENPAPADLLNLLNAVPANWLFILDEVDRLEDRETIALLTDTIKAFSDYAVPATFLLVGVASDVSVLIGEHPSIERCLTQVRMPRMTPDELAKIVKSGLAQVDMRVDDAVRWYIPAVSQGYPHYTHLLSLHAARQALRAGRDCVERSDIAAAIRESLEMTERSIRDRYSAAVYSPNPAALYAPVLLACAMAQTDDLGYFNTQAVREPLSAIMNRNYNIPAFARHLDAFCKDTRGPALIKEGQRRRFQYRFAIPLMRPFVLLKGINDGLIDAAALQ